MNRPAKIRNGCDGNMASGTAGSVDRITLARVIKDLPAGHRKIFLLHEIEGYEHPEIIKMLDRSVGNSKSQLHKAKLRIRESLGEAGKSIPQSRRWRVPLLPGFSRDSAKVV
jgi:hypothetical protein